MSELLAVIPGRLVPGNTTPLEMHNQIKLDLTSHGWRMVKEDITDTPLRLIVIPPDSEALGNAQCREVLGIETESTRISFRPMVEALKAYPQVCCLSQKAGGTNSNGVTIAGVTVNQAISSLAPGNTPSDNLRALFEALQLSTDPVIQDWDWLYTYPSARTSPYDSQHIIGIRKTAAPNQVVTPNANVAGGVFSNYRGPGVQIKEELAKNSFLPSVTIDLSNGFIYFFQINRRGLALGSRTNVSFYGLVHACWGDHAQALAGVPEAGKWGPFLSPVELLVGTDESPETLSAFAYSAKYLSINDRFDPSGNHPFGRFMLADTFYDAMELYGGSSSSRIPLGASSLWVDNRTWNAGKDFQIHQMGMVGGFSGMLRNTFSNDLSLGIVPAMRIEDWYKFCGTATDENLLLAADTAKTYRLAQSLDVDGTTIALESAAGLPATGSVQIENEAMDYAGITGNTLTGVARGKYGTAKARHFSEAPLYLCNWFIKINGSALFCGPTRPV